ncbi:chemotaxis protein CheX [Psychrobium sp. 1_MG-2023]|uniref:chemotaxis protein CheX n=1 Tax=Psychrobium sp. 1_MG-2023 TaxID=3062624 RepID=UPI000C3387E1|nr:chemotaxis protein CheX [Psychrobium sp. 1_MG-2023]MDP2561498.1 chemotaxis protein CheX [Psychrobium sp. 1_MG-2023]PKF57764.1 chemotaxis protein CheX [Alteromonadales bacterium alter-6D02]
MNVDFINPFLDSLLNVLSTMASTTLKPGKPALKKNEVAHGDVSGLIGMVGPNTKGSLSISFEESLALQIMHRMLGESPSEINEEVTDMVGEITNMVTGGAKNLLGNKGYEFDMATPVVVSGKNHSISHMSDGTKIMIPFTSPDGNAVIEICFDK